MASDQDYMAFLDKANQDVGGGQASAQQHSSGTKAVLKTMDEESAVPKSIENMAAKNVVYTSDADEPFQQVSLKLKGEGRELPDEVEFAELIHHWEPQKADVTIMDTADWDRRGEYGDVIEAVREATKGNDVRVYRVQRDQTRVEFWVVSSTDGRLVGLKALAVES